MAEIRLKNWEAFEAAIEGTFEGLEIRRAETKLSISDPLFRGQELASWQLTTTLERFLSCDVTMEDYHKAMLRVKPAIESFTDKSWDVPAKFKMGPTPASPPPSVEFMAFLRHHGFPSPLLDWSLSPYVAAFFAFRHQGQEDKDAAIYSFVEYIGGGKTVKGPEPRITGIGHYLSTQKRHHTQQCEYTICTKPIGRGADTPYVYTNHEEALDLHNYDQDFLMKYVLPRSERAKALEKLSLMNINAYSLFGNEESLMETLAYKELERKFLYKSNTSG